MNIAKNADVWYNRDKSEMVDMSQVPEAEAGSAGTPGDGEGSFPLLSPLQQRS